MPSRLYNSNHQVENWFAFEEVDEARALERKKKHGRVIMVLDNRDEQELESKKMRPLSDPLDDEKGRKQSSPIRSNVYDPVDGSACARQIELENGKSSGEELEKGRTTDVGEQASLGKKPLISKPKLNLTCYSKDSTSCLIASGSMATSHSLASTPSTTAHAALQLASNNEEGSTGDQYVSSHSGTRLKSHILEEAHDEIVMLNGKAKMSDIKTIYEKSKEVKKPFTSKDVCAMVNVGHRGVHEGLRLVEYKRRTKRMRGTISATQMQGGAILVKCPICHLTIPGDIHDADFSSQMNLHVDSCIGGAARQ